MTAAVTNRRELWRQSSVWRRAFKLGFTTGLLQAAVNQGDVWLHQTQTWVTVFKTIASPVIGFTLVLVAAAETWVQKTSEEKFK